MAVTLHCSSRRNLTLLIKLVRNPAFNACVLSVIPKNLPAAGVERVKKDVSLFCREHAHKLSGSSLFLTLFSRGLSCGFAKFSSQE